MKDTDNVDFEPGDSFYREGGYLQAVSVAQYPGVAFYALGWEVKDDADTEWTGIQERTGKVICEMVGDDRHFSLDPADLTPLKRSEYCGECGQIGCHADGYDPDEDE